LLLLLLLLLTMVLLLLLLTLCIHNPRQGCNILILARSSA
jgi:hypothetical protein